MIASVVAPTVEVEPEDEEVEGEEARRGRRRRRGRGRRVRRGVGGGVEDAPAPIRLVVGPRQPGAPLRRHPPQRRRDGRGRGRPPARRRAGRSRATAAASARPAGRPGPVALLVPLTYMNDSGDAVGPAAGSLHAAPGQVLVVHDELDLPFGTVRGKVGGGARRPQRAALGHPGPRRRPGSRRSASGVGKPPADFRGDGADWVLMRFTEPREEVEAMIRRGADMVEAILAEGMPAAVERFHASEPGARARRPRTSAARRPALAREPRPSDAEARRGAGEPARERRHRRSTGSSCRRRPWPRPRAAVAAGTPGGELALARPGLALRARRHGAVGRPRPAGRHAGRRRGARPVAGAHRPARPRRRRAVADPRRPVRRRRRRVAPPGGPARAGAWRASAAPATSSSPAPRPSSERVPADQARRAARGVGGRGGVARRRSFNRLAAMGYERVDQVEERGDMSVRGGILDVYPSTAELPARIELFGDEIESMRAFSAFTQRTIRPITRLVAWPAAEGEGRRWPTRCDAARAWRRTSVVRLAPGRARRRPGRGARAPGGRGRRRRRSPTPRPCRPRSPAWRCSTWPPPRGAGPAAFDAAEPRFTARSASESEGELQRLTRGGHARARHVRPPRRPGPRPRADGAPARHRARPRRGPGARARSA